MRRGFNTLAAQAEKTLEADPFCGHLFVFRGRRGDLLKIIWWDSQGACLFSKRLERGRFVSYDLCQWFCAQITCHLRSADVVRDGAIRIGEDVGEFRRSLRLLFGGPVRPHIDGTA